MLIIKVFVVVKIILFKQDLLRTASIRKFI